MFEICRKCGKVIEDVDAKRTYEIYDVRKGLRKYRMLRTRPVAGIVPATGRVMTQMVLYRQPEGG